MDIKSRFISELEQSHRCTQELLQELESAHATRRELYPTWTVKELLAHLTGWDDACIASLGALARDEVPATPAARGINPYNASTVLERQALSLEQVIQEWESTRQVFLQAIRDLPPEKLEAIFVYPWGPKGNLAELVAIFVEHETEHSQEIRETVLRT